MTTTKIPPALTKEDQAEHIIVDMRGERFVVEDVACQKVLKTYMTKRQTMEFVWLYDGRDYEIKPRLGTLHDDKGCNTGAKHQLADLFGAEWDVCFKEGHDQPWRKSRVTAYGATKRAALLDLLDEGFRRQAWSSAFYVADMALTTNRELYACFGPDTAKRMAHGGGRVEHGMGHARRYRRSDQHC